MKHLWILLALFVAPALAQTTPNFTTGQVPSAAQWNSYFGSKQDNLGMEVSVLNFGAKCDGNTDDSPSFTAAIAALPHGGVVDVPATGASCVLKEGINVSSSGNSGVTLRGAAGLYWPGPYNNTESDWEKAGSWIRCDDSINACLSLNGNGSGIERINVWYNQPTPPGDPCGVTCTFSHSWTPTAYPFTIAVLNPQNFNHISDVSVVNGYNCIDVEGNSVGVDTIFTHIEHVHLGCFNTALKMGNVDNTVSLTDFRDNLWWYPFNPNVVGYTEGDQSNPGHKIGWDFTYVANLQASDVEFYQDAIAIRASDSTVTSGLGAVTFGADHLQMSNISFNQVCEAVGLTSSTTHFTARMANVILAIDPQTSFQAGQCGQATPYAFNLNSDNAEVAISNLDGLFTQSVANVGGGNAGILHVYGARTQNYSAFANGAPAFNVNHNAALDINGDLNELFTGNAAAGPHISGNANWPILATRSQIEGAAGTARGQDFMTTSPTGGPNSARWTVGANNEPENGSNAGSNFSIYRYADSGAFIDTPFYINRANGMVVIPDGIQTALPTSCTGHTTGTMWNNLGTVQVCP